MGLLEPGGCTCERRPRDAADGDCEGQTVVERDGALAPDGAERELSDLASLRAENGRVIFAAASGSNAAVANEWTETLAVFDGRQVGRKLRGLLQRLLPGVGCGKVVRVGQRQEGRAPREAFRWPGLRFGISHGKSVVTVGAGLSI